MSFEELEHTADVLMRVRGATLGEVFADAGRAMFNVMYGPCEDRGVEREVRLEAENLESLLIDYLSELLFITEVENTVFCTFDIDLLMDALRHKLGGGKEKLMAVNRRAIEAGMACAAASGMACRLG
jgi:SHS2 domain-containing protein